MMMGIIIKDLSYKLSKYIDDENGKVFVDANWVNDWLSEKGAPFLVSIVDENNNEIKTGKVLIQKKEE